MGGVRALALVVAPDEEAPWSLPEVVDCIQLFAEAKKPVLSLLLPGVERRPAWPEELPEAQWVDLRTDEPGGLAVLERRFVAVPAFEREVTHETKAVAGEAFTEPVTGIRLLWIPGDWFQMGGMVHADEQPMHQVEVRSFWLGETPVTNRQYGVFLKATGHREPELWRDRRFSSPEQPVVGVSWEDATAFCGWLSAQAGIAVVLPSEAQWEYAARGSDGREYPWGPEPPDATRACFGLDWEEGRPAPVGSFPAGKGPFGTLDQAGNVWEWCLDVWDEEAYARRKGREVIDPVVMKGGAEVRVFRGGGWGNPAVSLRAAVRNRGRARHRYFLIGFRVAVAPPSP